MHITAGTHGTRETVGLPGTGISYTAIQGRRRRAARHVLILWALVGLLICYVLLRSMLGVAADGIGQQPVQVARPTPAPAAEQTNAKGSGPKLVTPAAPATVEPTAPRVHNDPPSAVSLCPPPHRMTRDGCQ